MRAYYWALLCELPKAFKEAVESMMFWLGVFIPAVLLAFNRQLAALIGREGVSPFWSLLPILGYVLARANWERVKKLQDERDTLSSSIARIEAALPDVHVERIEAIEFSRSDKYGKRTDEFLHRLVLKNTGAPSDVTVRVTAVRPHFPFSATTPTLHREGDNPPDDQSFSEWFHIGKGMRQAYDFIGAIWDGDDHKHMYFCFNQIKGYRYLVTLDGDFDCDVTVYYRGHNKAGRTATIHVEAVGTMGWLNVTLIG